MKKFPSRLGGGAASFCGGVFSLFCLSFIKTCDFRKTRIFTIDKIHERSYNETKFRAVCCLGKSVNPFGVVPPIPEALDVQTLSGFASNHCEKEEEGWRETITDGDLFWNDYEEERV